jgi:hypothetical protein
MLAEKLRKTLFSCRLFPRFVFNRIFGRFSAWGTQKHYKIKKKIRPDNLKKSQEKVCRM